MKLEETIHATSFICYWPTLYLIDKTGHIRYVHIGEGAYDETEKAILALLNEP